MPVQSPAAVLAILAGTCAFFFALERWTRWKLFEFLPPLIFIYLVPVLLSNMGLLPFLQSGVLPLKSPVYDAMRDLMLPMMLVMLLVNVNVAGAVRVMGRGLIVMLFGTLGVVFGARTEGLLSITETPEQVWCAVGPEGGFSDGELDALTNAGFVAASLGRTILRVDTAVAAALTVVQDRLASLQPR